MVAGDLFMDLIMTGFAYWPEPGEESVASEMCREIEDQIETRFDQSLDPSVNVRVGSSATGMLNTGERK